MNAPSPHFHRIAWAAVALALVVIVFGAFVRLSNAGLSCPDWPTCYGRATWPAQHEPVHDTRLTDIRPLETHKAWREQGHRIIAGGLGLLTLALALLAARGRRLGLLQVSGAALLVALSIPLYMREAYAAAAALAAAGEVVLLFAAWRWNNRDLARIAAVALAVIVFQALLGMWTVTWLLKPVVVMGHLLGGLSTLSLLLWMAWRSTPGARIAVYDFNRLTLLLWLSLAALALQIALGGWTSANYAALACGTDFPTCLGAWWPDHDFAEGFVLWRGIGVDYEGGVLDGPARVAIQLAHRLFALVASAVLLLLALRLWRAGDLGRWAVALAVLLALQLALGISNVLFGLPLWVATAHTAGAVALLVVVISLLARLQPVGGGARA